MPKFNDITKENWKEQADIITDSLWIFNKRDNSGKHDGSYHGNFIPQIPRQLIKRYTKPGDIVLDPFMGSGTTAFVCEELDRKFIGIDIQPKMVDHVRNKLDREDYILYIEDSQVDSWIWDFKKQVQLAILHPPYWDIIKFSNDIGDLSNNGIYSNFKLSFDLVMENVLYTVKEGGYIALVAGDAYRDKQVYPIGFDLCKIITDNEDIKLKGIIIKNMAGNRAKQSQQGLWRYRALMSDYYIFKHEYIFVFKKEMQ